VKKASRKLRSLEPFQPSSSTQRLEVSKAQILFVAKTNAQWQATGKWNAIPRNPSKETAVWLKPTQLEKKTKKF
jgi:hypothetical protein